MKKAWILLIVASVLAAGCSLNSRQKELMAESSGALTAVAWIGLDGPSPEEVAAVKSTVEAVRAGVSNVVDGAGYYDVLRPVIEEHVLSKVPAKYQAIASRGAKAALAGVDTLFARYPAWKAKESEAAALANAFLNGVVGSLELPEDDPVLKAARQQSAPKPQASTGIMQIRYRTNGEYRVMRDFASL